MKRNRLFFLTIALLLISSFIAVYAQTAEVPYHEYLKDGKEWKCQLWEEVWRYDEVEKTNYSQTTQYGITVSGDTLVNGKVYKKLYMTTYAVKRENLKTHETTEVEVTEDNRALCEELMREEGRKVYLRNPSAPAGEWVLHDFSLNAEQTDEMADFPPTVELVDTIFNSGNLYRRFHLRSDWGATLIEGIGSTMDPRLTYAMQRNDGKHYTVQSVYEDDQCVFTNEGFTANPYVPLTDYYPLLKDGKEWNLSYPVYDLQGRRLKGLPAHGLYIQDGRKILR